MNSIEIFLQSLPDHPYTRGRNLAEHFGLSEETPKVLYAKALGDFEAGRWEACFKTLSQLAVLRPQNEDTWILMGNALNRMGRHLDALGAWETAMACAERFGTAAMIARTAIALNLPDRAAVALLMGSRLQQTPEQACEINELIELWYADRT